MDEFLFLVSLYVCGPDKKQSMGLICKEYSEVMFADVAQVYMMASNGQHSFVR
jgi:hypothetical protein